MEPPDARRVVHLELHTRDLEQARSFYAGLCRWPQENVQTAAGSYLALQLGRGISGGIVEGTASRALWLPYVEVEDVRETTERAQLLGARVLLSPREGPVGWRSVVASPSAGELAFWQPKR
jgi:hypothetical protein